MCFWLDYHDGDWKQTRISNIVKAPGRKPGAIRRETEAPFTAQDSGSGTQHTNVIAQYWLRLVKLSFCVFSIPRCLRLQWHLSRRTDGQCCYAEARLCLWAQHGCSQCWRVLQRKGELTVATSCRLATVWKCMKVNVQGGNWSEIQNASVCDK